MFLDDVLDFAFCENSEVEANIATTQIINSFMFENLIVAEINITKGYDDCKTIIIGRIKF